MGKKGEKQLGWEGLTCYRCQANLDGRRFHGAQTGYHDNNLRFFVLCLSCYEVHQETRKWLMQQQDNNLIVHLTRAKQKKALATLTPQQWYQTKAHFGYRCAYCQIAKVECLDHFIPIDLGGGTTADNCVPACNFCNRRKHNIHPMLVRTIPTEDIRRVHEYLLSLHEFDSNS